MHRRSPTVQEGEIYEVLYIDGKTFEIRYGFYEDYERDGSEPIPIYPDLEKTPVYGDSGKMIVTHMKSPCAYFKPQTEHGVERCCGCCVYYPVNRQMMSVCEHIKNKTENISERSKAI